MPAPLLTRAQAREVDRRAIEELGIPGIVLMENAARHAAEHAIRLLRRLRTPVSGAAVSVICGGGNNGGDGFAIARHLENHDIRTHVYLAARPDGVAGDAATNLAIIRRMKLPLKLVLKQSDLSAAARQWRRSGLIIDALLGTGFTGQVRGILVPVIHHVNAAHRRGVKVLAVDLPSGLDCDTGRPSNATISADLTVTFVARKVGFTSPRAKPYLGRVVVVDIGAPRLTPDPI